MTKLKNVLLLFLVLLFITSCASPQRLQDQAYEELRSFSNRISEQIKFDPYSAVIFYDNQYIQNEFIALSQKMESIGCDFSPIGSINYLDEEAFLNTISGWGFQNNQWALTAHKNLPQGWAITQLAYPKGGMLHGDYSVKGIVIFYISWCGGNGRGGEYGNLPSFYIDIKNDSKANSKENLDKTNNKEKDSLKKLKNLLDDGLIEKKDYEKKKEEILKNI